MLNRRNNPPKIDDFTHSALICREFREHSPLLGSASSVDRAAMNRVLHALVTASGRGTARIIGSIFMYRTRGLYRGLTLSFHSTLYRFRDVFAGVSPVDRWKCWMFMFLFRLSAITTRYVPFFVYVLSHVISSATSAKQRTFSLHSSVRVELEPPI